MAAARQEFDASAALLGRYSGLPYVKKLGYSIGEMAGRILLRVIIDYGGGGGGDESHAKFLTAVRKAREFRDMMPGRMRGEYEVVPMVTDADEGALRHFRAIAAVIDR